MNVEAYPGQQQSNRINIVMVMALSSGLKMVMPAPNNTPILDHIRNILKR